MGSGAAGEAARRRARRLPVATAGAGATTGARAGAESGEGGTARARRRAPRLGARALVLLGGSAGPSTSWAGATDARDIGEAAYLSGELGRSHLDSVVSQVAKSISSVAFGGADRKTVYMGNLLDDKIYSFRSPIAGAAPSHWNVRI